MAILKNRLFAPVCPRIPAASQSAMSSPSRIRDWLMRNRTSVRLAVALRMVAMGLGSLLSFVWTRLLLRAMGDELNGLFTTFQGVTRLGGLGDLGMGAVVGVKGGEMLARGDEDKLRKLLASARSLFGCLAALIFVGFLVFSPWLPAWLRLEARPGSGSMPLLFIVGGLSAATFIVAGYLHSLNYAHGTVTWPILPTVLIGQALAPFAQWILALHHAPLWVQTTPYIAASVITGFMIWLMLEWSHPWLGDLRPLGFDLPLWKTMAQASGWFYLLSLGNAIYTTTDRLVINAWFGPSIIPTYYYNYKICELGVTLVLTGSLVSLPKITQWFAKRDEASRARLRTEAGRLNVFQIVLGCAIALGYLTFNDLVVRIWLGSGYRANLAWQVAFACNLVITTGGDAGIQISTRCGDRALKAAGLAVAGTGLLNLVLSLLSASLGSITGVAVATVIAQSVLSLSLGWLTCRHLELSAVKWAARSWLLPLTIVIAASGCKTLLPDISLAHIAGMTGCCAVLLLAACLVVGVDKELILSEWATIRGSLKG
jgi:O-antigen/teichoic acid export membrane protein